MTPSSSGYLSRCTDPLLEAALRRSGAVLLEGIKACGKTATASQRANSTVHLDLDPGVAETIAVDPLLLLEGATPRLLDEWQLQPRLWDAVRREVDARSARGQFILTGSTAPGRDSTRHSGAGRIARLTMRTLSWQESGDSSGTVSLAALHAGEPPRAADPGTTLDQLLVRMAVGGWPGNLGLAVGDALANNRDYVRNIVDVDIDIGGSSRDPLRVLRLLTALARSVATEVTISTLARDEASLSRDAVRDYLDTLSRIFVVDDQPAWSTHLRSSATLRKEPKRHLGDPSLSVALLGADPASLRQDLGFAGQLFESAVVHDLRVFAETLQARVFHARDSSGREVDAIVQTPDGRWSAFEVKLGSAPDVIDRAAVALRRFAQDVTASDGHEAPLTVIVGRGPSYRRPDGVNVVAMSSLGA